MSSKPSSARAEPDQVRSKVVVGVVVGRICMEQISVRTDNGATISVRVHHDVGARLDLGARAEILLDENGRVESIRPHRERDVN